MDVYFSAHYEGQKNVNQWADEPEPLSKRYLDMFFDGKNKKNSLQFSKCPAVRDYSDNVFVVTSPYDYELSWDGNNLTTSLYDQNFFESVVYPRDISIGFISFKTPFMHLFAEKSLIMEFIPAYFHDNEFTRKMLVLPGRYDVGQHFRRIECACRFRECGSIKIKRGDPLYYLKFHTNEKITFKRFFVSEKLFKLSESIIMLGGKVNWYKPLDFYYSIFKKNNLRKVYLKQIRENLL